MDQIKQIDQNQDNNINTQELLDAIKPNGFLSNENNLEEVGKLLNNEELNDGDKELLNSLTNTIDEEINRIIESGKVTEEDTNLINVWKNLLGENDERVQKLEELISQENNEGINNEDEINTTSENIIQQKYNDLSDTEIAELATKINIGADLINDIDTFLNNSNTNFLDENIIKGTNILNKIIKEDPERHEKLEKVIKEKVINMSKNVNTRIGNNEYGNIDYYRNNEKMLIQLRANVCYGEDLIIDGKRGANIRNVNETNEGKTNIYIYQLELKTRKDVREIRTQFSSLLNIPNLDAKFNGISQDAKENIMREFLEFFLDIRVHGMFFENKIGSIDLEKVLTFLINAEKYKNVTVNSYYERLEQQNLSEEERKKIQKEKEEIQNAGYLTIGQYYKSCAEELKTQLLNKDKDNVARNKELAEINELNSIFKEFQDTYKNNEMDRNERREKLGELGKKLLNNPRLDANTRKEIILLLGSEFSDIQTNWENDIIVSEIVSRAEAKRLLRNEQTTDKVHDGIFRGENGQIYNLPSIIKCTKGIKIDIEYHIDIENTNGIREEYYKVNILVNGKPIEIREKGNFGEIEFYLDGYKIYYDELGNLIIDGGTGSELRNVLGEDITNEYRSAKKEVNIKQEKYEEYTEILTQMESEKIIGLGNLSENSINIINDETGYTKKYEEYMAARRGMTYANTQYAQFSMPGPELPKYNEYHELNIPGCEGIIVHIKPGELNLINNIIQKHGKNICYIPTDKSNKKIYELTINDLKICEKDSNGNIHIYEIKNDGNKGNEIKSISSEEINDSKDVNNIIMTTINNAPGLWECLEKAEKLSDDCQYMQNIFKKFDRSNPESLNEDGSRGINDTDINNLRIKATETATYLKELCEHHNDFVQLKKGLEERFSGKSNITTEHEKAIKGFITNLDYLIDASLPGGDIQQFCDSMLNSREVHSNDERLERVGRRFKNNFLKVIGAIAGGVLAVILAVPSGGCSLLAMAAIMTAGGMVGGFVGQVTNEALWTMYYAGGIEIEDENGIRRTIEVRYDDPTSLELAMDGKISRGEYAGELALNFVMGTATTFGCMAAGQLVGGWISKACETGKHPKLNNFLTRFNKNFKVENGDPMTDGIFKALGNKVGSNPESMINQFNKRFFYEFQDELKEEITETGFDELSNAYKGGNAGLSMLFNGLAFFATARHCITPGGNMARIQKENGISLGDVGFNYGKNALEITLDYDGDYDAIVKYYEKNHFKSIDGHLEMPNPDNPAITNIIYLNKTSVPIEVRSITSQLSGFGITVDSETGKQYYESTAKLHELEMSGMATVSIDPTTHIATVISGETTLILEQNYFGGRSHQFEVNENQARQNSEMMDNLLNIINEENKTEKLQELRNEILEQYKQTTSEELNLTDEQLLSILDAHEQDGILGELTIGQLRQKVKILSETITDPKIRRFLLEAGFCGSQKLGTDHIGDISKITQNNINDLLDGKTELKISEMTINDLGILIWKAANMGLDEKTLQKVKEKINERINTIKSGDYNIEHMRTLENNIAEITFEVEIRSIEINDPNFETKIDEIKHRIYDKFGESSKIGKELTIEISKKEFEYYKKIGDLNNAKLIIAKMEILNNELLTEDITNFRYKRGLLDTELLKIQLGDKQALQSLEENAKELREDTESIGGRADINTLLSKIEAGILLGKPQEELDAYLSFLAIQEQDAGVNVLGNVISTISNTFPEKVLDANAKNITDAGNASNTDDLKQKGTRAKEIAEEYKGMKEKLAGDKNGVERKILQDKIDKFVYETPINSITDIGNTFMHPLKLFNYGSVASIEISENTYGKTLEILQGKEINGARMQSVDMDGNREPTADGFGTYIQNMNEAFDLFIRTLYSTEKLQELNSAHHSAGYDANMKSYLEEVGLNDLAQIMKIQGIEDCRVHAFTKQILFDTFKRTQLQSLQKKLNTENNPAIRTKIEKQIKILKNTKMVYIDSSFSGNVRMEGKYQAEKENGHMIRSSENAIIEEHTYNLIEIPTIDPDGNITGKNVFYADAFYQGIKENCSDTGKVYDLSFNPNEPITTIYGRTYYNKIDGKYVHDPKVNMSMSTEVIGSDGNIIPITTVPLFRSVQGRGESLKPTNVETEVLSESEISKRNAETRAHVEAIERLNIGRSEMVNSMKEALKSGNIEKLEDILINGIGTAMSFNADTGTRETRAGVMKISDTQAIILLRAIAICEKHKGNIPANMQQSLNIMLDHIVIQDEVNYRLKSGNATDVDERIGIFWNSMQVFNDVYKTDIENAITQINPDDTVTIENLMNSIKEYQIIFEEDMGNFLKRTQETMAKENERNETYHRNNFEHIAKRFQANMEICAKAVEKLESMGLYEQSYEIQKYMLEQGNKLLNNSEKLLGHMIDFKKVKKEMKGIEGREVYIQLIEIQAKGIGNIEAELKKRGMDSKKIKEMVGIDINKPFNSETLSEAINNIEESGLKEYYDIIALVFNPDIMAINMANAVYSKGGYKVGELFNIESKEEYAVRKYAEAEIKNKINENTESGEIGQILYSQILEKIDPTLLSGKSKSAIQTEIQHLADLCSECGIKGKSAYDICKQATEALIFQTAESQTRIMGDHGINHISGNIQKLNIYLEAGVRGGKISTNEIGKYKLMGALTHIFHDIGYAAIISKGSGSFDGSAIHPFTSKVFFESNVKPLLENTGIDTNLISHAIESHDGTRLDFSTPGTTFLSMVNLSDNMALGVDKMAQIWSNPKLLNHIATLYALDAAGIDLNESNKIIAENIRKDSSITPAEQESLISAVNELSGRGLDNVDFWSISPLTAMEFSGDVPTLSMYKGANLMLVAEVCGISRAELETAIKNKDRNAIISLIKGTKFCSQIVKPLGDYADNYEIMDSNGHKYQKVDGKYNLDVIKADLLLGKTVSLNDGKGPVLNYRYEIARDESILAERNSVYGHIYTETMLYNGVDAKNDLKADEAIKTLGEIKDIAKKIKEKIENTEDISTEIATLKKLLLSAKDLHAKNTNFTEAIEDFANLYSVATGDLFELYISENNYEKLGGIMEELSNDIDKLSATLLINN